MKFTVQNIGTGNTTIKSKSVAGFTVNYAISNLGSGIQTYTPENQRLTVQLNRDGVGNLTLFSAPIHVLAKASGLNNMCGKLFSTNNLAYTILLPQVINLTDNDSLTVSLQTGNLGTTSTAGNAQFQYTATVNTLFGVGVERYTPKLLLYQVPSGDSSFSFSAGDYVTGITVVSPKDKITAIDLNSSFHSQSLGLADIISVRAGQFSADASALNPVAETGSFDLYKGHPIQGATVSGSADTNVSGNTYIAIWAGEQSPVVRSKSRQLSAKIEMANNRLF